MPENEILHTEATKKEYSEVEGIMKGKLTETLLLSRMGRKEPTTRGLSVSKDFDIREYSPEENSKFLSNPSNIKHLDVTSTKETVKDGLLELIDNEVDDADIALKYKEGINEFLNAITRENIITLRELRHKAPKFYGYLHKTNEIDDIKEKNVRFQVAKILFNKFGDEAFNEDCTLSQKSLDYIFTIFYNATLIWEQQNKSINEVFHDLDFPFVAENKKTSESNYIRAIIYLVDKQTTNFFGKRGDKGQSEWCRKKSSFADILRALTDNQLNIHKINFKDKEKPIFDWDDTTNNIYDNCSDIMKGIVDTYNDSHPDNPIKLSTRKKSSASCVSKIFESKKINDAIGLRLSCRGISEDNFGDIIQISKDRFKALKADFKWHPEKYISGYTPDYGETISIRTCSVDNKGILSDSQIDEVIDYLSESININKEKDMPDYISISKRQAPESPYTPLDERQDRMKKHYPEIVDNPRKWKIIKAFYKRISDGPARGKNGDYKDFKYNVISEIKEKDGNCTGETPIEVQVDDINNGIGLANYNIRNIERRLNRESKLSFSVPLKKVRQNCEINLKHMWQWADENTQGLTEQEKQKFFTLKFPDGSKIDISSFSDRNDKNSASFDEAIIKIINYFLQKGTFILCDNNEQGHTPFKKYLLSTRDLYDWNTYENLHICSSLELASQQHSYLLQNRNRKVGIYLEKDNTIGRTTTGELLDPINLGKKKDPRYSAGV